MAARIAALLGEVRERVNRPEGPFAGSADTAGFLERKARLLASIAASPYSTPQGAKDALDAAARVWGEADRTRADGDVGGGHVGA